MLGVSAGVAAPVVGEGEEDVGFQGRSFYGKVGIGLLMVFDSFYFMMMPTASYFLPIEKVRTGEHLKKSKQIGPPLRGALNNIQWFYERKHPHQPAQFPRPSSRSTRPSLPPAPHTNCTTAPSPADDIQIVLEINNTFSKWF